MNKISNRVALKPVQLIKSQQRSIFSHLRKGVLLLYFLLDVICLFSSFYLAYAFRFGPIKNHSNLSFFRPERWVGKEHFQLHFIVSLLMGAFLLLLLHQNKLYTTVRGVRYSHELIGVLRSVIYTMVLTIASIFLFQQIRINVSRIVLFTQAALLFPFLFGWRFLKRKVLEHMYKRGYRNIPIVIVGAGRVGLQLKMMLEKRPWLGIRIVGFLDDRLEGQNNVRNGNKILGRLKDFPMVVDKFDVREIWITIPSARKKVIFLMEQAHELGVSVKIIPETYDLLLREVAYERIGPLIVAKPLQNTLSPTQSLVKRVEDIVGAILLLFVFAPLTLVIALAIKLEDGGPLLFKQTRIGMMGTPFKLYKFRSMSVNVNEKMHRQLVRAYIEGKQEMPIQELYRRVKNRSVTRVGRIIRKFHLDEIPQLINVLRGEMSLVGPRPPLLYEYEKYQDFYKKRLNIKPGITGLWQVNNQKYKMDFEQLVLIDIQYINEWSVWLDLKILVETIGQVIRASGI